MKFTAKLLTLFFTVATATLNDVTPNIQSDSPSSLRTSLKKFSKTRHHLTNPSGKEKARRYIRRSLRRSGLHVWSEYIDTAQTVRGENIVGMLKGKRTGTAEDKIVIVGAHYDTTSRTRGVDDNGSGVTALLQAAKQIGKSGCKFQNTIFFVAFDYEEDTPEAKYPVPSGSQYFVRNLTKYLSKTDGTVKGALVLEMLANHNTTKGSQHFPKLFSEVFPQAYLDVKLDGNRGNFLAVIGRTETDEHLMTSMKKHYKYDANFKLHLVPIPLSGRPSMSPYFNQLRDFYRSDHYNFWENSVTFPAVMITDTSNFRAKMDKCYHKKCDGMKLIDKNDLEFLRRNINVVIGATLELSVIDSCHSKKEHTAKSQWLLISLKTANHGFEKSQESKKENKKIYGNKRNITFPTDHSESFTYSILTALVPVMHCVSRLI